MTATLDNRATLPAISPHAPACRRCCAMLGLADSASRTPDAPQGTLAALPASEGGTRSKESVRRGARGGVWGEVVLVFMRQQIIPNLTT